MVKYISIMTNKKTMFGVLALTAMILAIIAIIILAIPNSPKLRQNNTAGLDTNAAEAGSNSSISSNGLNVSAGGADSLGQLVTTPSSNNNSSNSNSAGSSSSSPIDPSSFSEYDKYSSNSTALFGDVAVGTGAPLSATQKATITYKGWLTNGSMFSESATNSNGSLESYTFTIGDHQIIPGLEEGIIGMKVGGTRLIIIPPALGYGSQVHDSIPANSVLVFEVSLLSAN
jgi:FKBP-type peptidyl-prolyl cis-trans isomerase FkpA